MLGLRDRIAPKHLSKEFTGTLRHREPLFLLLLTKNEQGFTDLINIIASAIDQTWLPDKGERAKLAVIVLYVIVSLIRLSNECMAARDTDVRHSYRDVVTTAQAHLLIINEVDYVNNLRSIG